jgi:Protein of unknown function (DUF3017)
VRDLGKGSLAGSLDATGVVATALTGMAGPPTGPVGPPRAAGSAPGQSRRSRARRAAQPGGLAVQLPYLIVLGGVIAGLALVWQGAHYVRPGTLTVAGAVFVAVAARLVLPEQRVGLLANRRRAIDVTALAILAVGLLVAGLVLPIPW